MLAVILENHLKMEGIYTVPHQLETQVLKKLVTLEAEGHRTHWMGMETGTGPQHQTH